ncbi:Calcineurin-like phosphoesterase domain ApaH type, partial [Trinorchestia longiramus]
MTPYFLVSIIVALNLRKCEAQISEADLTLSILHLNDVHARFEQTNVYSGRCTPGDELNNRCYGGFARIHTAVKNLRAELPNSLFLAAGDYFQGTVWYTVHRYKAMAHFLNIINHDAM